ncbi:hypothetical protein [Nitrosophilus kaiyonis]|uniref:hypothetical protein n=1 Tax=Nitrosophilus kaiyonis TaxID=2930200 RepID=UPI00249310EB|nr:hypothetical protein [Nitrosophilus kaiyonis]
MLDFFKEEAVYIYIALFVFGIALFIVTRPFMPKKSKIALPIVAIFLILGLLAHYFYRINHIKEVAKAFNEGKNILCIDKTNKIGSVLVKKGEWKLKDDTFIHPEFPRGYNIRQCIVE